MAKAEDGSVVRIYIQQLCLRCFSLLPAAATSMTALPAFEATSATIAPHGLAVPTPTAAYSTASSSTAAVSTWAATSVRSGALSVVSRNNKSPRSVDLEFHAPVA